MSGVQIATATLHGCNETAIPLPPMNIGASSFRSQIIYGDLVETSGPIPGIIRKAWMKFVEISEQVLISRLITRLILGLNPKIVNKKANIKSITTIYCSLL
ncbi:hypothetical protein J25TS5_56210 [Paenibacillus faecis]|nr:hypothetical protein J25TS5_56210 [Paenibacillus faecis]